MAAKRDQIEEYANLARNAKLKPVICDIDAFTVQNLFEYSRGLPADQTIAVINVGASFVVAQHHCQRRECVHTRDRQRAAT